MEHFILSRKVINLDKNKDTALPIPVLFNPASALFEIEFLNEQFKADTTLELTAYRSTGEQNTKKILVKLEQEITRFKFSDLVETEAKDYLLYSCRANHSVQLSLTIIGRD